MGFCFISPWLGSKIWKSNYCYIISHVQILFTVYEFGKCDFTLMHSTNLDPLYLAAFTLMQIACWLITRGWEKEWSRSRMQGEKGQIGLTNVPFINLIFCDSFLKHKCYINWVSVLYLERCREYFIKQSSLPPIMMWVALCWKVSY